MESNNIKYFFVLTIAWTVFTYSAQQKTLIHNKWSFVSILGIYKANSQVSNNDFPFSGIIKSTRDDVLIDDMIDFNSSNNDIYKIHKNEFNLSSIDKFDSIPFLRSEISAYRLSKEGAWEIYSTKNLESSSNDFTKFEISKAYWVKAKSTKPLTPISIIIDNNLEVFAYYDLKNAWNLLALNDDIVEHSSSAFFIPQSDISFSISRISKLSNLDINEGNIIDVAKSINYFSQRAKIQGEPIHIRAYPTRKINDASVDDGIIILSDTILETSAVNALSSSGKTLRLGTLNRKIANIEHFLAFKVDDNLSTDYKSQIEIKDLNNKSEMLDIDNNLQTLARNLQNKAKTLLNANAQSYLINIDFNDTTPVYDSIFLSSDKPFGLSESFYVRKFKHLMDGNFYVTGADARAIKKPSDINGISSSTGIYYHNLSGDDFEISSIYRSDLDLFSNDKNELFTRLSNTNKGYLTKIYRDIDLFNSSISDTNISGSAGNDGFVRFVNFQDNLSYHSIYTERLNRYRNQQKFFLDKKEIVKLYTAEAIGDFVFWRSIDFTKPSKWFDIYDRASLFRTNKELAYYAYFRTAKKQVPLVENEKISVKVAPHFGKNTVYNVVAYKISFDVANLSVDKRYVAYVYINSKAFAVYDNNGKFEINFNSEDLRLRDGKNYKMTIKIANNTGAIFINKKYDIPFKKPKIDSAKIENNHQLIVRANNNYEVYVNTINEINRKKTLIGKNIRDLSSIKFDSASLVLKVVAYDNLGFYSDPVSILYGPSDNPNTLDDDKTSKDGVSFKVLNNSNAKLRFNPVDTNKLVGIAVKTMFLKAGRTLIGSTTYDIAYKNKGFFIDYDNKIYKGIFQNSEKYASDNNAYPLQEEIP